MRLPFQRSRACRGALVVLSCLVVLGLVQTADAGDMLGLRGLPFLSDAFFGTPEPAPAVVPIEASTRRRAVRRIWASSRARPLRIRLDRERRSPRSRPAGMRRGGAARPPCGRPGPHRRDCWCCPSRIVPPW